MAVKLSGAGKSISPNTTTTPRSNGSNFLADLMGVNGFGVRTSFPKVNNPFSTDITGKNAFGVQTGLPPVASAASADKAAQDHQAVVWAEQPKTPNNPNSRDGVQAAWERMNRPVPNNPPQLSPQGLNSDRRPDSAPRELTTSASGATTMPDLGTMLAAYGDFKYDEFGKSLSDYIAEAGDGSELISSQLAALDTNRQGMKDQAQVGDATIKGMYEDLQGLLGNQAKGMADINAQQQANNKAMGQQSADNLAAMAQATGSDYADLMKTIGFSIDPNNAAYKGMAENAALNQLVANDRTQTQANLLQEQAGNTAEEWARYGQQAGLAGNQQRVDLQTTLQGYLADLAQTEAAMRDQAQRDAWDMAKSKYGADWDQYTFGYDAARNNWMTGRDTVMQQYGAQMDQYNRQQAWNREDQLRQQDWAREDQQNALSAQAAEQQAYDQRWKDMSGQERASEILGAQGFQPQTAQTLNSRLQEAIIRSGGNNPAAALELLTKSGEKPGEFGYGWSYSGGPQYNALLDALNAYFGGQGKIFQSRD